MVSELSGCGDYWGGGEGMGEIGEIKLKMTEVLTFLLLLFSLSLSLFLQKLKTHIVVVTIILEFYRLTLSGATM